MSFSAEHSPDSEAAAAARFFVTGDATPGLAPRVLELFAKRNIVPDDFRARAADGVQSIEIRAHGMDADLAAYIGRCLRQIVSVERVLVSRDGPDDGERDGDAA
jgi:hypothetical protein